MRVSDISKPWVSRDSRFALGLVLACWITGALFFSALPQESGARSLTGGVFTWAAALFTCLALAGIVRHTSGSERTFWAALGGGVVFRLIGDAIWMSHHIFGSSLNTPLLEPQDYAYALSYTLLFGAMLRLVSSTTRRITFITALDALSIMLSVSVLVWYFVLGPVAGEAGLTDMREILVALSQPICDAALLFLTLVVLSTGGRSPFAGYLAASFTTFLVADGLYLEVRAAGPFDTGNWPEMVWALGTALMGVGVMKAASSSRAVPEFEAIKPWRVFSFWFGPLSPAVHFTVLLVWGAANPPLPAYALWASAAIVLYLAFRLSFAAYLSRKQRLEAQRTAVRGEQGRISEELRDTLQQNVDKVSMLLGAYQKALEIGDSIADRLLERTVEASREASYMVGQPIKELSARHAGSGLDAGKLIEQLIEDVDRFFGIRPHSDLRADLNRLEPEELAAAYRIASEALWNAAKHSGAQNVWLQSRNVGSVTLVKVRDDGRGIPDGEDAGPGLLSMRARAEESSGILDIHSGPWQGTTVQVRFQKK